MKINKFLLSFFFILILASCSKEEVRKSVIKEKSLDLQVLETYQEGMSYLEEGDALYAAKNLMKLSFYSHNLNGLQNLL